MKQPLFFSAVVVTARANLFSSGIAVVAVFGDAAFTQSVFIYGVFFPPDITRRSTNCEIK